MSLDYGRSGQRTYAERIAERIAEGREAQETDPAQTPRTGDPDAPQDASRYADMAEFAEAAEAHARRLLILLVQLEAMEQLPDLYEPSTTVRDDLRALERMLIRLHGYAVGRGGQT